MRDYKAADRDVSGFVERREFRLLLNYIIFFNRLWEEFEQIDAKATKYMGRSTRDRAF